MIIGQLHCALSLSKGHFVRFDKLSAHTPLFHILPLSKRVINSNYRFTT